MNLLIGLPLIAFLLGSIPFGVLIAKSQGINIREHGSGNIGATNVLRIVGKKFGISCFILDFLKGFLPLVLGINLITFEGHEVAIPLSFIYQHAISLESQFNAQTLHVLIALCSILGHNYSPWVGFKGGKGIATSAGAVVPLMPIGLVFLIAIWFGVFKLTRYVSVASMAAAGSLPFLVLWGSWHHGKLASGEWNKPLFIFSCLIAVMAIWKHRSNIKKLINGTEHKFSKKKNVSEKV
jgi:glycerol-3-phosphate acyltransferase PlsY